MSYQEVLAKCQSKLDLLGRPRESLKILAVSKLQPVDKIRELHAMGPSAFGENYVQEALDKINQLRPLNLEWHFIGSLQKNKVKFVVGNFALIHSVDSSELASVISRKSCEQNLTQNILIQVNLSREFSKGGFSVDSLKSKWEEIAALPGLSVTGLMTMPPLTDDPEEIRPFFRELAQLRTELKKQNPRGHSLRELSMGTSHDYLVAIEEGATIVRLGTILFGERPRH